MRHYLGPCRLRIFATKSNPQLTRVDVHMKNGMEKPMTQIARRTSATPSLVARAVRATICAGALALAAGNALAQSPNADQATRIYNRIAGIPPTAAQLAQMTAHGSGERGARRHQRSRVLQQHHPQHGGALDQPQSIGVRAAQRLHGDRRRHGARQCPVQHPAERGPRLYRRRQVRRAGLLGLEQRDVRRAGCQQRRPERAPGAEHSVGARPASPRPQPPA